MEIDDGSGDLYITIGARKLADRQISCLMASEHVAPYPILRFTDRDVSRRYYELGEIENRKEARRWLEQRGILAKLPLFDPAVENVSGYTAKLERFCRLKPGSALKLIRPGLLTVKDEWVKAQFGARPQPDENDKFTCLIKSLSASNLKEHGVEFGFIGHEAYPPTKSP
jgi:hypothetical protein